MAVLAAAVPFVAAAQAQGPNLQALHDALRLTSNQEASWRVFAAASAPDPDQAARARAAQSMMPALRSPQRVDLGVAAMEADLATLQRRGEALKAFYATLTPDQQTVFDRETLPSAQGE